EAIDVLLEVSPRAGSQDAVSLARLSAIALEIVTRAPGTMRHRVPRVEGERYLEIGLEAAGPEDSEERVRLLVARSFAPDSFRESWIGEDELEGIVATGEEAAAMAERLQRVDLQSAALDGIASAHQSLGRYGPMEDPIRRRLELVPNLSDPYEI